ncbi:endonuclease/exonuclease/phosphatase family protein [Vaginella massiliensis]|uniref:endonuclease/exonuclease/phosphatase family protein n=1 Tax=Vaginella massiliensis TaxID=1816680 RepID=UPI00083929D5|nr:endonuclease/exonuclease/phosphatase family protein [Vaginella massiliensis]
MVMLINVLILLMAYSVFLNAFYTPSVLPYFNYLAIGYVLIFCVVVIFLLYWILVSWRHAIGIFILSLGVFYIFSLSYPLNFFKKTSDEKPDLSVMSFNAHFIRDDGTDRLIAENLTDVMIFQEAYEKNFSVLDEVLKDYYSEHYDLLAIYSKYPIIETKQINFPKDKNKGIAAYADIDTGSDTIRIINIYLETMRIDKKLVKSAIEAENSLEAEQQTKEIESKLVAGMIRHEHQLNEIMPFIKQSKHPIIVGSDLNATPASYEYFQLTKYLKDSFLAVGSGNATTFHSFNFPIRIDYLFHSNAIKPISGHIIRKKYSDHYPVFVNYKLPKNEPQDVK